MREAGRKPFPVPSGPAFKSRATVEAGGCSLNQFSFHEATVNGKFWETPLA